MHSRNPPTKHFQTERHVSKSSRSLINLLAERLLKLSALKEDSRSLLFDVMEHKTAENKPRTRLKELNIFRADE